MNSQGPNGWHPAPGQASSPGASETPQGQQRTQMGFGHSAPSQSSPQPPMSGNHLIQQSSPFYSTQHNLPNPQNLPHSSPLQHGRAPLAIQQSPPRDPQRSLQPPGYTLPTLGPVMQAQQQSLGLEEAERDVRERERAREFEIQQELRVRDEYERQRAILEQRQQEAQQRAQHFQDRLPSPREAHTSAIPIQQPVASRIPATLHGPNGILNEQHPASGPSASQSAPPGPPNSHVNNYGANGQQSSEANLRAFTQHTQGVTSQQLLSIGGASTPQQLANGGPLSQQQQPILNDALSYLDQVKVQFQAEPDVYNRFLDIMKDFKSQAIDTPGVIDRVSQLFTGHPQLIQGFNTFLPPGYRIECGTRDDPNAIRVTTPMGTTVQQMPSFHNRLGGPNGHDYDGVRTEYHREPQRNGEWVHHPQEIEHQSDQQYHSQPIHMDIENRIQQERAEQGVDSILAQQHEQHIVSDLVSAASNSASQGRSTTLSGASGPGQATNFAQVAAVNAAAQANQLGMEKRGPVEFNHAIGYVNKIKNRFAQQPEIYRQFLDILQTYQRESKPIQDVYAQVTQLFSSAPDLLEDFKQFLPESAAQAKAQAQAAAAKQIEDAAVLTHARNDPAYGASSHAQVQTPRPEMKMPPVGNFAPPSVGKDNKKRRGGPGSQVTGGANAADPAANVNSQLHRNGIRNGAPSSKRARMEQTKPSGPEILPVSPTLVPALPTPMAPQKDTSSTQDQIAFFDRVKKYLANKQTFNEFLKLCNLFTQDLIDKSTLMLKAHNFIGGSSELYGWFSRWVKYDGKDEVIHNQPRIPGDKVVLSNCRGLGPSYRLLPKRERLRECRGRDEVCLQVLNDVWVSHPTWASEDSGFVAHRKNQYEEALHRIEEERHDYDINIEACTRTMQLMEPIVQQLKIMSKKEQSEYRLASGLGGQSETIYQRVIKKIYDRERGQRVIEDMFKYPSAVLPVVFGRLQQKCEEWKASQREWEKVWREQTNRIFWKSLDHQGINTKASEKRQFQPKTLQTEIQVRYEEQRRQKIVPWNSVPNYQFRFEITDMDVIQDAAHLSLTHLRHVFAASESEKQRIDNLLKTFITTFFDLDREAFDARMMDIYDTTPPNEEAEETTADAESTATRSRRVNGKKSTLLRGVLERGKIGNKAETDSKESTPDIQSNDEDALMSSGTPTEQAQVDATEHRWLAHPVTGNKTVDLNVPFKRDDFHLYASAHIYCLFRMIETVYDRLLKLKESEAEVHKDVQRSKTLKPADKLNLTDKKPSDYFQDTSPSAVYYEQMLTMFEDNVRGEVENSQLEETLRRFYLKSGWQMYSLEKMLNSLNRFAMQILISDNKDKSLDVVNLFYRDRKEDETTHQAELTYRKQVEKLAKDGDIYRIRWNRVSRIATIQTFTKEMKTYEADELAAHARWSYYVSSFSMLDRTEGVPPDKLQFPFLRRNLPSQLSSEDDYSDRYNPLCNEDGLVIRIAPNNYHMLYDPGTMDWLIHGRKQQKRGLKAYTEVKESRLAGLKCLTDDRTKSEWMRGKSDEAIQETLADFAAWIADGPPDVRAEKKAAAPPVSTASTSTIPAVDGTIDTDVVMAVTDAAAPPLAIAADANTEDQIMGGT